MPRPYMSDRHLWSTASSDAGTIAVWPQTADRIYFDAAKSSHMPANLPDGEHGSSVLDIGHGVQVRASGNVIRNRASRPGAVDQWTVQHFSACQYPSGRDLTPAQGNRAVALIGTMLTTWALHHEGDIAQADDIDRNNAARSLEEKIETHQAALKILRRELRACENGRDFTQYPDLPTDARR